MADLGIIKYLRLKDVWPKEAADFVPWLVEEKNLADFSNRLGIELQFEQANVPVGPYFADILAKDARDEYVVIEVQFNKSDHDHLGKLITYGATLGAKTVIWISETFTDEHRKSIAWLNENTNEDLALFAVKPKVIQIDFSKPAVEFEVEEQPNEVVKAASIQKASGDISESRKVQLEFWQLFEASLLEKKVVLSAETPAPKYWFNVPLGRSNIHLSNILNTDAGRVGLRVYLHNKVADRALEQLIRDKDAIEKEIGSPLQWNPNPENADKTIVLSQPINLDDRSDWRTKIEWLTDMNARFRKAFMPRVKGLKLSVPDDQPKI